MTIIASDDFAGLADGVTSVGRTLNNARGGSGTRTWAGKSASHTVVGAAGGGLRANNSATSSFAGAPACQFPRYGKLRALIDQSGGNLNTYAASAWSTAATASGTTSVRGTVSPSLIRNLKYLSGATTLASKSSARSAANIVLELSLDPAGGMVTTVFAADGTTVLDSIQTPSATLFDGSALPPGDWWTIGFQDSAAPQTSIIKWVEFDDGQGGGTVPTITAPNSFKTGRTTADITASVSEAGVGGELFYALTDTNVAPADFDAMVATPRWQAVSASGVQTINVTGLTPGQTKYVWLLARNATRDRSAIVPAGSFTTDAALPSPAGSSSTILEGGKVTITFSSTGGTVESATASLPVASPANGAVAQGPVAMVYNATARPGVWSAEFTPPAGDYDVPVVLASNADNPSVSITGATAFHIDDATGTATPGTDTTAPTLTSPTLTSDAPGFITAAASTNEATGQAYAVVTNSATKPTNVQVKAGQGTSGAAAPWSGSALVTAVGAFSIRKAHSLGIGTWYAHIVHEDGANNLSAVATSAASAINEGTKPQMQGTVSLSGLTQTGYTVGCDAATDNVGVTGYQVSLNGGADWIEKGASRTHTATGRTPATTDTVQWRAYDAAGNYADPISRDVTLDSVPAPVITTQPTSASVIEGNGATLTAAAMVSPGTLSWEWFTRPAGNTGSGTAIPSSNAAALDTGALVLGQSGVQFSADAINTIGGVSTRQRTNWATITVTPATVLPPGPGGVLTGISPPALFQLLALAGD